MPLVIRKSLPKARSGKPFEKPWILRRSTDGIDGMVLGRFARKAEAQAAMRDMTARESADIPDECSVCEPPSGDSGDECMEP